MNRPIFGGVSMPLTAIWLAFFIVLTPIAPVFAQEAVAPVVSEPIDLSVPTEDLTTPEATLDESNISEPIIDDSSEAIDPDKKDKKPKEEDPEPQALSAGFVGPVSVLDEIANPAGRLSPEVDNITGALVYTYKIIIPPGRNAMTPDVSLVYNSANASQDSVVGSGWSIDIPNIQRINKDGSNNLFTENYYTSSLDGELISLGSGNYGAKDETGNFNKYSLASSIWTVTDKSGTVYKFGNTADARQDKVGDSTKIFKWMLQETRDTNDNYNKYEYYKDAGQIYPSKITYTGNGSTDGVLEVNFDRTSRTGGPTFFNTGFSVKSNYRITEIRTEVSDVWARKYTLAYTTGDNTKGSYVDTITEAGQDDSSVTTTLPVFNANYSTAATDWTYTSAQNIPVPFTNGTTDIGMRTADINGDGLVDILCHNDSSNGKCSKNNPEIWIQNQSGTGWTDVSSTWLFPYKVDNGSLRETFLETSGGNDAGLRVMDVNGDLRADLVRGSGTTDKYIYINNGSGWTYDSSWNLPSHGFLLSGQDYGFRMADINGDGLPDVLCHNFKDSGNCNKNNPEVYLNTGTGWVDTTSTFPLPQSISDSSYKEAFIFSDLTDTGLRVVDINGDGLADLVRGLGTTVKNIYINNGSGWTYDSFWTLPLSGFVNTSSPIDYGFRMGDINGDGLPDVVCHNDKSSGTCNDSNPEIRMNNGDGTWTDVSGTYVFPTKVDNAAKKEAFTDSNSQDLGLRIMDINGDGIDDFVRGSALTTDKYTYLNNEETQSNLVAEMIFPQGGSTTITYKASPQFRDGSNNLLNPASPVIAEVVLQTSTSDGLGGSSVVNNYEYAGGAYYFSTYLDRKFAGFNKVTKTDSASNKTINYFHQGNSTDTSNGEYSDHASKIGKVYRTEVKDSSGNMYSLSVNKWDKYDLGSGRNFVKNIRSTELTYDGDSSHKDKAEEYTYDNTYGNLTQKIEWGEVTGSTDGTFTDTGSDKFTTDISYAANTTPYIVGLPSQDTKIDQSSNKVKENKYYYDTQTLGNVTDGNLTKQEMWKVSSTYVDIEKTYNTTYGIVTQEKDPRDKATNYSYDTYNLYPTTVTNALSQATAYTYDYTSGKVKQVTDPNTRVYQNVYDGLDRVTAQKQPDLATPGTLVTKTALTYTDTSGAVKVQQTDNLDGSTSVDTYTYIDGLGRPIQVRKEMEDSNTYAVTDTIYNNIGQVNKKSVPYSSSGSSKTSATTTADLLITYTYDPMVRVSSAVNAIGTTSNTYSDWKLSITDPGSKLKHQYNDSYGNLIKVEETNSGSTYTTLYEYNGNNNLTKITDASSNVRNFTYDGLGRRLTAQDLHASADGTYGTWTYAYDDSGNQASTVDPNSQTINYTYDNLNRIATEDYTGVGGTEVTYTYDSGTDGVGKLTSVTATGANSTYTYDANGNLKQEVKNINSTNYQTDYTYDRLGNQLEITNPDSSKVKYAYNTAGQLETIQRKESTDGSFINLVTDFDYGPHGKVTYQAFQNGSNTTNTYDAAKLYRLSRKQTQSGSGGSTTVTLYPSAGDGYIYHDNASWDTAHDAATGTSASYTSTTFYVGNGRPTSTTYRIRRAFIPFDTSSLPDSANITGVKLKVYVTSKLNNDNDGDDWLTVVQTTQPSTSSLTTADFDLAGAINNPTEGIDTGERKDITSIGTGAYLEFNLNTTGKSWVNATGYTKLGLREGHDVIDSAFTGTSGQNNYIIVNGSEATGTANDPILEVTYTTPNYLQDQTYTYDANSNITRIVDASNTNSSKTVDYTYDDLNRLLSATATNVASGQSTYTHNYTYDGIGNILTRTDAAGSYTYAGTNYANPHATTSIGSVNYTYDNNGNMLTETSGLSNTWDYNNRLTQAVKGGVTSTYAYDHSGQRVKLANGTTTSYYPTKFYNTDGTTPIKHIMTPDGQVVTTVKGTGGSAAVYSVHTDHLNGSNVATNSGGTQEELMDYFPYGNIRLDQKAGSFSEQRKFTGYEYDADTALNYAGSRYYHSAVGRFTSQDPVFLALGDRQLVMQMAQSEMKAILSDPQGLNSYAYVRNNPLRLVDPQGEWFKDLITGRQSWNSFVGEVGDAANYLYENSSTWKMAMDNPYTAGAVVGIAGGAAAAGASVAAGGSIVCGILCGPGASTVVAGSGAVGSQADRIQETSLSIGQNFGKLGTTVQNIGQNVTGYTRHGLDQKITRGISTQTVVNTTRNPLAVLQQSGGTKLFLSEKAAVVLNKAGQVVTTYGKNLFRPQVQSIVNRALRQ